MLDCFMECGQRAHTQTNVERPESSSLYSFCHRQCGRVIFIVIWLPFKPMLPHAKKKQVVYRFRFVWFVDTGNVPVQFLSFFSQHHFPVLVSIFFPRHLILFFFLVFSYFGHTACARFHDRSKRNTSESMCESKWANVFFFFHFLFSFCEIHENSVEFHVRIWVRSKWHDHNHTRAQELNIAAKT